MAVFEIAYRRTAANEGFYSDDPVDPGGETIYGIARKKNPRWKGWELVDSYKGKEGMIALLKADEQIEKLAINFYKLVFWDEIRGDELVSQTIANSLYDSAVNFGPEQAIDLAQRALKLPETKRMDDVTLNKLNNK